MKQRGTLPWLAIALLLLTGLVVWLTMKMTRTDAADFRLLVIGSVMFVGVLTMAGALSLRRR